MNCGYWMQILPYRKIFSNWSYHFSAGIIYNWNQCSPTKDCLWENKYSENGLNEVVSVHICKIYRYIHDMGKIFVSLVHVYTKYVMVDIRQIFCPYLVQYMQNISVNDIGDITWSRTTVKLVQARYHWYCGRKMGVMWAELQISKEVAILDDRFKYASEVRVGVYRFNNICKGVRVRRPSKTFKGKYHLEFRNLSPHLEFHFKLEHLYCFYPS